MKGQILSLLIILTLPVLISCGGKEGKKGKENDTISVPDTGFTGISKGTSGQYVINEITYKNGIRHGLMKTFYRSGNIRQTFWYQNGLRQDSARWFFEEGQLFRTTPYLNDTVDGIQKQYYRTGQLRAKLGYKKGYRTSFLQEFTLQGKLVTDYPEIVIGTQDNYGSKGTYRITLALSDKSEKVNYYRGEFFDGVFDTTKVKKLKTIKGAANMDLKKSGAAGSGYVGVIGEITTDFGNRMLVYRKVELPYNDLK
jgi:hypothetical protein